jgi:prepilin-type N-terminal cleavage/methylation domain-containing protein
MKIKNKKLNQGFTLMETLVTIFIFGILMVGTTTLFRDIIINSNGETLSMNNVVGARNVSNTFIKEIRNSVYGVDGSYPIIQGGDTQIVFFSTTPRNNGTISRVRYYVSNGVLYKGITDPTGSPLKYILTNEVVTTLLTNLSLGGNPLFYYYNGDYDGNTSPLTQPVNLTQVKFVRINIVALKQLVKNSTDTFTISAGAVFRNLKNNLGN